MAKFDPASFAPDVPSVPRRSFAVHGNVEPLTITYYMESIRIYLFCNPPLGETDSGNWHYLKLFKSKPALLLLLGRDNGITKGSVANLSTWNPDTVGAASLILANASGMDAVVVTPTNVVFELTDGWPDERPTLVNGNERWLAGTEHRIDFGVPASSFPAGIAFANAGALKKLDLTLMSTCLTDIKVASLVVAGTFVRSIDGDISPVPFWGLLVNMSDFVIPATAFVTLSTSDQTLPF